MVNIGDLIFRSSQGSGLFSAEGTQGFGFRVKGLGFRE